MDQLIVDFQRLKFPDLDDLGFQGRPFLIFFGPGCTKQCISVLPDSKSQAENSLMQLAGRL
jgi:hypothetical protein